MRIERFLLLLLFLAGLWSCARIAPLSGGDKDTFPPKLQFEESTPNYQTEFKKQAIELTFDEWLDIKDAFNQVVVSPPLEFPFELNLKKKTAVFTFDDREQLRDNATYTINFGDAVRDFTEGNIVPDLRFVFSTGRFIDSLQVTGTVVDAITGKPMDNMRVMLYTNLADSVVRTELPFYFSKTDKSGRFRIQNVREDSFKVFVLDGQGFDYLFNSEEEQIGFLPDPIYVSPGPLQNLSLQVFKEEATFRDLRPDRKTQNVFKITYNQEPSLLRTFVRDSSWQIFTESEKDTLRVWYQPGQTDSTEVYIILDENIIDTFDLYTKGEKSKGVFGINDIAKDFYPKRALPITFALPIAQVDTSLIRLLEDTLFRPVEATYQIDSIRPNQLLLNYNWNPELPYRIELDFGAVTSWLGSINDTIREPLSPADPTNFGNIKLSLTDLDSTQQYVLQLQEKNKAVGDPLIIRGQNTFNHRFSDLRAGTYNLFIVVDENRNGRWDTGNYDEKRQPEKQFTETLEQLRANWDLDAAISFKTLGQSAVPTGQDNQRPEIDQFIGN